MPAAPGNTLIVDLGRMVGHQHSELELPRATVEFFGIDPDIPGARYIGCNLSNGATEPLRVIYRPDNGMWRIEFTQAVPEIAAGVFPVVGGMRQDRSNKAAIFTRTTDGFSDFDLDFDDIGSASYLAARGRSPKRPISTPLALSKTRFCRAATDFHHGLLEELDKATRTGFANRTRAGTDGRNFGWY